ncbi:hypothetical protein AAZX31_15G209700 [Glycine max]
MLQYCLLLDFVYLCGVCALYNGGNVLICCCQGALGIDHYCFKEKGLLAQVWKKGKAQDWPFPSFQ